MIKFYRINKTQKYYEPTKLTIRLKDGAQKDYSYTTDIRIVPDIFDFKGQGYPLKETKDNPERLQINLKINQIMEIMKENYLATKSRNLSNKDFKNILDNVIFQQEESKNKLHSNFADEFERYIDTLNTSGERREAFRSVACSFRRFEYYQSTISGKTQSLYRYSDVNADVLNEYRIYLQSEHLLYAKHIEVYRFISKKKITFKKKNTIIGILKKVHTFSNYYKLMYRLEHDPFWAFKIGVEKYEEPIPLTDEEYEVLQNRLVDNPELQIIQKMFILQSFFGVRYVDFSHAKKGDIVSGCLIAYPKKTIELKRKISIPLNDFGVEIIGDLNSETLDTTYLVPRYTLDQYNTKLKELFRTLGFNRIITRYDEEKGEMVHKPLYELVSSHMARRTFINTLINEGYDSITVKNMAGMSENSREIERYYTLNRKHRQECSNSLDKRKQAAAVPIYQLNPNMPYAINAVSTV